MPRRRAKQQAFVLGRGRRATRRGPQPKGARAGISHLTRPALAARFPAARDVANGSRGVEPRSQRCFRVIERAMYAGATRFGFRLVHYAVMGNHLHLLVEAPHRFAWRGQ